MTSVPLCRYFDDADSLDEFSTTFARMLFTAFPDLRDVAEVVQQGPSTLNVGATNRQAPPTGTLLISTRSPSVYSLPFSVDTAHHEIMIGFGSWHEHYAPLIFSDSKQQMRVLHHALSDIEGLLHETRLLAVAEGHEIHGPHEWLMDAHEPLRAPSGATGIQIYSWSGRFDRYLDLGMSGF